MQIANGTVILSPENQLPVRGVTPAEALILHKLHRVYSNGTPLGDFYIQSGEAQTIDSSEKAAEEEWFNPGSGRVVPAKAAVPAITHKRTQQEEAQRLRRKYTGNISENGTAQTAFVATFGTAIGVRLPETFSEIEDVVGITFKSQPVASKEEAVAVDRRNELLAKLRSELCEIAVALKIKVHSQDTKEAIVTAIMSAESPAVEQTSSTETPPD